VPSLAELRRTLATLARIQRQAPVILDPQPDVPLGDVIDALDTIQLAGFAKVSLAATP
jgi:biopolymer transport protein ExbD